MRIRLHKERLPRERRVALVPKGVADLTAAGHEVAMPPGSGLGAGFTDDEYGQAGARVDSSPAGSDLVVGVGPLDASDLAGDRSVIGFLDPLGSPEGIQRMADSGVTAYAMELVPRSTLAQSMDALSSQATAAGYAAVLLAAEQSTRFFPMLMTAAGTIRPSRVLVLGAGVAGLQAIATARRLGAIVSGYDIRPAAREQVESLGASFVGGPVMEQSEAAGGYATEVDDETRAAQQRALADAVAKADVVITTAQVPGRRAPVLLTSEMVGTMKPGAVVVDLAASTGGNCELTVADETVESGVVKILGPTDLASRVSTHASEMFSRNVTSLIDHLFGEEGKADDENDEIAAATRVTDGGAVVNESVLAALQEA